MKTPLLSGNTPHTSPKRAEFSALLHLKAKLFYYYYYYCLIKQSDINGGKQVHRTEPDVLVSITEGWMATESRSKHCQKKKT